MSYFQTYSADSRLISGILVKAFIHSTIICNKYWLHFHSFILICRVRYHDIRKFWVRYHLAKPWGKTIIRSVLPQAVFSVLPRDYIHYFSFWTTHKCWQSPVKWNRHDITVYPKKYAHGFCFAVLCCGYTLTDFLISIRLTSLALWQSNDCPSASKATLMNMDKYFMWIHYERLHNHNKAKHNKTVFIFPGIYCK